jgi:hypothetical protein
MKRLFFIAGLLISLALLWPLVAAPYFSHHDDVQVIRLYEMSKCLTDGQIPCRWVPDLGGLYGYPLFNYYAPLPYYFGAIIFLISGSLLLSAKLMFAVSFIGSFVFMYLLGRRLWGEAGGAMSAIFYILAPYHSLVFYVRGAMGEMWGLMFYPAILWSILRLKEQPRVYNLLLLSLFVGLLFISHNLSAMIFMPVVLVFAGLQFFPKRDFKFLKYSLFGLILGLLLSSFYWLPMNSEKDLVHLETTIEGYFSYTEHFKGLKKLFLDTSWGWGTSVREVPGGEVDSMSFQIGWVHLLGWILALVVAKVYWKKDRKVSYLIIFFSLVAAAAVFMVHPRSQFVWQILDPLKYLQFPWRFLIIIIFCLSLISGSLMLILKNRPQKIIWGVLVVLVIAVNFNYFRPEKFIQTSDQELLSGANWDRQIMRSIYDFLPIYAKEPPAQMNTSRYGVLEGVVNINDYREGSNWFSFEADIQSHAIIRLSKYYFPEWVVTANGQNLNVDYQNNSLGLMTVILGPGQYRIEGRLYDTPIRTFGNFLSAVGLTIFVGLLLVQIPRIRRGVVYYLGELYR